MARPITLFTGQWADLPFEEVCRLASEWGFDGVEIACWGDHFEVDKALADDSYIRRKREVLKKHNLQVWAISSHLVGQAICDHPIDERHKGILPARIWGSGNPEEVRQRAAEDMKNTARAAARLGVSTVVGFTGSSIWHTVAMFPPVPASMIDAGYKDFADRWNPILDVFDEVGVRFAHEVHPSEIAYDYHTTVRTLEAIGRRPHLPRGLQGHESAHRRRSPRPHVVPPALGRPAPRLGLRLHRPRRRPLGGLLPRPERHRLQRPHLHRMGGRRNGPSRRGPRVAGVHPPPQRHHSTGGVLRRGLLHEVRERVPRAEAVF
jgi:sugar phosphate isomerase/epimerase